MGAIAKLTAEALTGWDFLVALGIVVIVEYVVKNIVKKLPEGTYNAIVKFSPVVIGAVFYFVLFLFQKTGTWYGAIIHGLFVGITANGSYDVLLKTFKEQGLKSIEEMNKAAEKAIEEDKKK